MKTYIILLISQNETEEKIKLQNYLENSHQIIIWQGSLEVYQPF